MFCAVVGDQLRAAADGGVAVTTLTDVRETLRARLELVAHTVEHRRGIWKAGSVREDSSIFVRRRSHARVRAFFWGGAARHKERGEEHEEEAHGAPIGRSIRHPVNVGRCAVDRAPELS